MMTAMVALMDKIPLQTMIGRVKTWINEEEYGTPKHYVEKVESTIGEATRDNILYLKQRTNIPVYRALKALAGY